MDPRMIAGERRRRGLAAKDVAAQLGITREAYGQIERELIEVTEDYADKMVEAMERAAPEVGAGK
jgi:transcriptional regulator with XRE-family HTH domain